MSKDAFYFKHDSNARNDEKLLELRRRFGMEGYGIYWAIIEKMREATDYRLNRDYNSISWDLRCKESTVKAIVEDYNLFQIDESTFSSKRLTDDMALLDKKRNAYAAAGRRGMQARWANRDDKAQQQPQEQPPLELSGDEKKTTEEPRKPRQKKYSDAETELHSKCRAAFTDIYRQAKGEEFVWSAKEMAGLVGVIADVKVKMKAKGYDTDNNDTVADNFAHFVNLIFQRADDWTKRNATPTLIHSKFNEIYTTIANKTVNGNKQTATNTNGGRAIDNTEFLARIAAGLQPVDAQ